MSEIVVVETDKSKSFVEQVNDFLSKGGIIKSCSCGVLDAEAYNFPDWFKAIIIMP